MGQGANILFNLITVIFLALTIAVVVVALSIATDSMEPPILAPEDTEIPPTEAVIPTLTPSSVPGAEAVATPVETETPEAAQ
jgi:hypothetical protein